MTSWDQLSRGCSSPRVRSTMPVAAPWALVGVGPGGGAIRAHQLPIPARSANRGHQTAWQARLDVGPHGIPRGCSSCRANPKMKFPPTSPHPGHPAKITGLLCRAPEHLGASHAHQMSPPNRRADHTDHNDRDAEQQQVGETRAPLTTAGGRSPLIIKTPTLPATPDQHPLAHTQLRRTGSPDTSYCAAHAARLLAPVG